MPNNELSLEDLRAPMTLATGLMLASILAIIFTAIPMLSEGVGNFWERGKELGTAFAALVLVMLTASVFRTADYYVFDEGVSLRIRKVDGAEQDWHPTSTPLYLRLSSFGCWARVLGPRAKFWPNIEVSAIRRDGMRLRLWDASGMRCDVAHPFVAIECIQRFNNVGEIIRAATQGVEEREELKKRFRSLVRELIMLGKYVGSLELDGTRMWVIQRQMEEMEQFIPSELWEEALASTSDIRKVVVSSARNRVAQIPRPRTDEKL